MLAGLNHYYRKSLRWAFENRTFWLILSGVQNLDIKFKSLSRSEYKKWQKDSGATDFLMKMGFDTRKVSIFVPLKLDLAPYPRFEILWSIDRFPIWLKSREFVISHKSDSYDVELNHMARNVFISHFYVAEIARRINLEINFRSNENGDHKTDKAWHRVNTKHFPIH